MIRLALTAAMLAGMYVPAANAVDCSDLKPTPTQNTNTSFSGKIDGAIDGLFAKVAGVKTSADGTYRQVATSVLQQFPDGDTMYMWERVLYLQCQLISDARDMSSREKITYVGELYSKFSKPPPSLPSGISRNSLVNTGDGANVVQGNGNSISVSRPKQP